MIFRKINSADIYENLLNIKQITLEVTDACNLKCKYCGYGDMYFGYDNREAKYMSFHQVRLLLEYLFIIWEKTVRILKYQRLISVFTVESRC